MSDGAWVTYYNDWSGIAIFENEIDALRFAVANHMDVKFVEWGGDIR